MEQLNEIIEVLNKSTPDMAKALLFAWIFVGVFLILFFVESAITGILIFASQVFILYWNKRSGNELYKKMQSQWRKLKRRL